MTYVVLDIGAGSRAFGMDFRAMNPKTPMLVLYGEPQWGLGPFFKPLRPEQVPRLIQSGATGVKRIISEFSSFAVPDESLNLVTLNSPHPFDIVFFGRFSHELQRCLKPGGLCFSSYSKFDMARVPESFLKLSHGRWAQRTAHIEIDSALLPTNTPNRFPQSFTLESNIRAHRSRDRDSFSSSYIYHDGISPGWCLWQKPV